MSSYFVNSLSTCYGQTVGLDNCAEPPFHRNGNYQHTSGLYPGFPGSRYPYTSKEERMDDQNGDYYGAPRLTHLPHTSPCASPHNLHIGTHSVQNVHPMHSSDRSNCNLRTSSGSSYYPNGQLPNAGGLDRTRSPPSQPTPPTPPDPSQQSQVSPQSNQSGQSHSPRPGDAGYQAPHIYPWMRRMQYSQGKHSGVFVYLHVKSKITRE